MIEKNELVVNVLKNTYRLKKKTDFKKVYTQGKKVVGRGVVLYYKKSDSKKIGFSVSKKIGNAVIRNKTKRILREICRKDLDLFIDDYYFVFIARVRIKGMNYKQIEKEIKKLLKEVKVC